VAHFEIPLDLPHAGTVSLRIVHQLLKTGGPPDAHESALAKAKDLVLLLASARAEGQNPPEPEASEVAAEAATLGRALVPLLEALRPSFNPSVADRIGQAVRNLFECLELGEEGAALSLRAGENPDSVLRPTE
jgi:hypothetical protein